MGESDLSAIKRNADGTVTLPKISQENALAEAQKIMQASGADKGDVRFVSGKAASDRVVFRNGAPGPVHLDLLQMQPVPGLSYSFDKTNLNAGEVAYLSVEYQPKEGQEMPRESKILFEVVPFNTTYTIAVHFDTPLDQ
jgi:hypothetical protein